MNSKSTTIAAAATFLLLLLLTLQAFAKTKADIQLEAGIAKEEVDGDLRAAMTLYQQIANNTSASRAVRAKALLRLARCEEKLGQQAREVYEQIVHDYPDQPAAAQARTRLAALKQQERPAMPSSMTVRSIEQPEGVRIGPSDTDGRRVVYGGANGNLWFSDLATRSKRLIFKAKAGIGWIPSRDFATVLLMLPKVDSKQQLLATININGSGYKELATVDAAIAYIDWSRDKQYVLFMTAQRQQLFLVHLNDGRQRELLPGNRRIIGTAHFSPDNQVIAFSDLDLSLFSIPVAGGQPSLLREKAQLVNWTNDGRFLAIRADRNGAQALFLQPFKDGNSQEIHFSRDSALTEIVWATEKNDFVCTAVPSEGDIAVSLAELNEHAHPGPWRRLDLRPAML